MMTWLLASGLLLGSLQETPDGKAPQDKAPQEKPKDLSELSLEELSNLEVTTASRKAQRLADVPAAVGVVRGDDIRRMGVRTIEDALRMIPGVNVSRIDGNKWSISIRGFSDRFATKLQVLVDGRSIYTPLFSGVFWEMQDTFIEDIDRIEVIRGPGGATWGANAVNGVINIITKKAADTQGVHVHAGGGTEERAFGGARYGGTDGDVTYRAWAKAFSRDQQFQGHDDTFQARGGFRADWKASEVDLVTLSGEYFDGSAGVQGRNIIATPPFFVVSTQPYDTAGGDLVARWDRKLSDTSSLSTQLSYTRSDFSTGFFHETRDTVDLDFSHRFQLLEGHDFIWGLGARVTSDRISGSYYITMDPAHERDDVESVFFQDEIALIGNELKLTLGARAEYNDYTGFELSPTARLAFRPHDRHLVWASVSRNVRTPSRSEDSIAANVGVIPPPLGPIPIQLVGNHALASEEMVAYEAGYRVTPTESLSFDLALFNNNYEHFGTNETLSPFPPIQTYGRKAHADTWGVELAATWQVADWWRVYGAYTLLRIQAHADSDSTDTGVAGANNHNDANGQVFLRSSFDLSSSVALDVMGRYVGALTSLNVERYYDMDVRLAWRATKSIELSAVGQNLLHPHHFENTDSPIAEQATAVERGVYFMIRMDF